MTGFEGQAPAGLSARGFSVIAFRSAMKAGAISAKTMERWRVRTPAEAVKYIDAVGYCMLFPVDKVPLPALYSIVARRDPRDGVYFDTSFERIWKWKDDLPRQRRAFYGKYFRGKGTLISRSQLPNFLVVQQSAVAPGDHQRFYRAGRIQDDARMIWVALEEHGPLATLELRSACRMDTVTGNIRFKRAVLDLQRQLIVSHFGSEQETGAWASGRYELTSRVFPEETAAAREISLEEARRRLAAAFWRLHPDAPPSTLARLFGWTKGEVLAVATFAREEAPDSAARGMCG